jgi:UDP-N-acetylglucosamine 2-epimerase
MRVGQYAMCCWGAQLSTHLPQLADKIGLFAPWHAYLALTGLGGVQEEAPSFEILVVVMCEYAERTEEIDRHITTSAGRRPGGVVAAARFRLKAAVRRSDLTQDRDLYGDGRGGERIACRLLGNVLSAFDD